MSLTEKLIYFMMIEFLFPLNMIYYLLLTYAVPFSNLCSYLICSVRTPISMKFFPRFFLLYFLVFHIYFFSYAYGMSQSLFILKFITVTSSFACNHAVVNLSGFSYLALSTTAAFMQHLILYFWNRFEVTYCFLLSVAAVVFFSFCAADF